MRFCFSDREGNVYKVAYLDASSLGGIFFDGLFLTITTDKHVDIKIEKRFKEGFMSFNEEYWINLAKDYIQNDIDFLTFLSEPDVNCETELFLEYITDE